MTRLAFVTTLLLVSLPAMAKTYTVTKTGSRWVINPSTFTAQIQPWAQEPKPDCNALFRSLTSNSATIDRCLPTGSQPTSACYLLKKFLPTIIFGVDDPTGGLSEDTEQYFNVHSVTSDAVPSLAQIARDENLPVSRLTKDVGNPWLQSVSKIDVLMQNGTKSWLPKLSQLDYLKDFVGKVSVGTDHTFGVRDRVSYCEIAAGQSTFIGEVSYRATVSTEVSDAYLEWLEGLYDTLKGLKYPLPGTSDQQALTVGFEMGSYLLKNPLSQGLEFDALETYKMFFQKTGGQLTLSTMSREEMKTALSLKTDYQTKSKFQTSVSGE